MTAPVRTPEQRASALERALEVRRERAALRVALKSGQVSGVDIVAGAVGAGAWHGVRVRWLLESLPGVGAARADSIMVRLAVPEGRRLGGLTDRQRKELLRALGR
jgi:guanylate kinase